MMETFKDVNLKVHYIKCGAFQLCYMSILEAYRLILIIMAGGASHLDDKLPSSNVTYAISFWLGLSGEYYRVTKA